MLVVGVIAIILLALNYNMNRITQIKVAVVGDYSIRTSTASEDAFRGIERALNQINTDERIYILERINIASYDDMESLEDVIDSSGADMVMGPSTSSQFLKSRDVLGRLDIPVFLLSVSSDQANNIDDNLFRLTDTLSIQVKAMCKVIGASIDGESISIYYSALNKGYSEPFALNLKEKLMENGKTTRVKEFDSLDLESTRDMLIAKDSTDAYVVIAGPNQAGIVAQLLDVNNSTVPIFFPTWAKDERTIEYSRNVKNEMYVLSSPEPQSFEEYEARSKTFQESSDILMNSSVYFGHEVMYFVNYLVSETQSTKLKDIKPFVHNIESYQGNYNVFTFNETGDGGRGYTLMKIGEDNFIFVEALN